MNAERESIRKSSFSLSSAISPLNNLVEARIGLLQLEVSTIGSEIDALKNKEGLLRDQFISQMEELNKEIREFQKKVESSLSNDDRPITASE
ncbi:PREDICTED: uncharacterized protein LOC104748670 isoform X2 [Camelina sativa]|uniref:Uncharacterized protein LOC104748670 isoform X2 n=1 Tax=Camelina sativa TaxID=90675 RepID=A0ABM0WBF0_CAMSA|nr:PREDICTED: uncharacterized protein LOC104748670 isoform X2 [Camelina sativa]